MSEECMICFDEDDDVDLWKRAPCGHYICYSCLRDYVRNELKNGKEFILCPYEDANGTCRRNWRLYRLKRINQLFRATEMRRLEDRLNENKINNDSNIRQCPRCLVYIRSECEQSSTKCPRCRLFFCWDCLKILSFHDYLNGCGCENSSMVKKNCKRVYICDEKCPSIRSCVNCGALIKHKENCKHVICAKCGQGFCFICLKKLKGSKWSCSYDSPCKLATRQI